MTGDVAIMRRDGTHVRHMTDPGEQDVDPQYSPDGTLIVFTRALPEGGAETFMVPANGGKVHRLGPCALVTPSYSPDGRSLVSGSRGTVQITSANRNCPATPLVGGAAVEPSWQPLPGG